MDLLHAMRIFVRVAEEGSMAAAARALRLAPAVVTRQLAQLETHLGARLLQRSPRHLSLTETGRDYLARAQRILAKVDEAAELVQRDHRLAVGRVRLAAPATLLSHVVTPLLPALRAQWPELQLAVHAHEVLQEPDPEADISLLQAPPDALDGHYVARLLAHSELLLCASPAYLARHGTPLEPQALAQHDVLLPPSVMLGRGPWYTQHRQTGERRELPPLDTPPTLETEHRDTLYDAARAGLGVVPMHAYAALADLRDGRLVRLLPDWHLTRHAIWAATPTRRQRPLRVRVVLDFLARHFGGEPVDPWLAEIEARAPAAQGTIDGTTRTAVTRSALSRSTSTTD